jgi:hypothetical protein
MLTGQAAGTLAAFCVKERKQPSEVSIREVQGQLLKDKAYIMPYFDVKPSDPHFISIQKAGATGILRGKGEPHQWANRTWFYPDSLVDAEKLVRDLLPYGKISTSLKGNLTIADAIHIMDENTSKGKNDLMTIEASWYEWGLTGFDKNRKITRKELAVLIDKTMDPFSREIDHHGKLK